MRGFSQICHHVLGLFASCWYAASALDAIVENSNGLRQATRHAALPHGRILVLTGATPEPGLVRVTDTPVTILQQETFAENLYTDT